MQRRISKQDISRSAFPDDKIIQLSFASAAIGSPESLTVGLSCVFILV